MVHPTGSFPAPFVPSHSGRVEAPPRPKAAPGGFSGDGRMTGPGASAPRKPRFQRAPPNVVVEDEFNPTRRFGFFVLMVFIFIRLSLTHEVMAYSLNLPTFLLLAAGFLTVLFTILTRGVVRGFQHPAGSLWLVFSLLLALATAFSSFIGGSANVSGIFFKTNLPMYFGIAGMVCTWRECRKMLLVMAWAGFLFVIYTKWLGTAAEGRLEIKVLPSIGNSNDLAAHMLYILPALIIMVVTKAVGKFWRFLALAFIGWGLYQIMSTGSRGALLGIASGVVYIMIRGTVKQKSAMFMAVSVATVAMIFTLDSTAIARLASLAANDESAQDTEAAESKRERTYLLQKSIEFSLQHPMFGVGPGMFGDINSRLKRSNGAKGSWQVTHNAYTEISSEAGTPALICVLLALVATCRSLRKAKLRAEAEGETELAFVALIMATGIVTFCVTVFFLAMGFRQYFIGLTGMGVAMANCIQHELNRKQKEREQAAFVAVPAQASFGNRLATAYPRNSSAARRPEMIFGR